MHRFHSREDSRRFESFTQKTSRRKFAYKTFCLNRKQNRTVLCTLRITSLPHSWSRSLESMTKLTKLFLEIVEKLKIADILEMFKYFEIKEKISLKLKLFFSNSLKKILLSTLSKALSSQYLLWKQYLNLEGGINLEHRIFPRTS